MTFFDATHDNEQSYFTLCQCSQIRMSQKQQITWGYYTLDFKAKRSQQIMKFGTHTDNLGWHVFQNE